jgi:hypothetical protein
VSEQPDYVAKAQEWFPRVAAAADQLTDLALEWQVHPGATNELLDRIPDATELDPHLDFAIPHAALVMDAAAILRRVVSLGDVVMPNSGSEQPET